MPLDLQRSGEMLQVRLGLRLEVAVGLLALLVPRGACRAHVRVLAYLLGGCPLGVGALRPLPCAIGQPLRLAARLLGCGNGCLLRLARQPPRLLEALARLRKEIVGSLLRGLGLTLGGLGLF